MAVALGACTDGDLSDNPFASEGAAVETAAGATGGAEGSSTAMGGEDSTDAEPDPDGPRLDVGPGGGTGEPACPDGNCDSGCNAVDVLFVVDNSVSMGSYQAALAAAAPAFADALFDSLPDGTSVHVGVTTSSFYGGSGGTSPGESNCSPFYEGAGLTDRDDLYTWYWTPDAMPYNENGAQGRLRTHEGVPYFEGTIGEDSQAMKDWLVGNIDATGESGSVWEMVAAGAAYVFHPANATANEGFVRDEGAVLAIFALTDEVGNSPEDVAAYHDMIVAAKQGCGGDACIVTGGVMRPCLTSAPDNRLYPLLSSFGKDPVIADIGPELDDCFEDCDDGDITECDEVSPPVSCADLYDGGGTPQYADALAGTLAQVIAETCESISPEG